MKTDTNQSIARLRNERLKWHESAASIGFAHGTNWAIQKATYVELSRLGLWWHKMQFPPAGTRYYLAGDVAAAINLNLHLNEIREAIEALFIRGVEDVPESVPNEYVIDWIQGAISVLQRVESNN